MYNANLYLSLITHILIIATLFYFRLPQILIIEVTLNKNQIQGNSFPRLVMAALGLTPTSPTSLSLQMFDRSSSPVLTTQNLLSQNLSSQNLLSHNVTSQNVTKKMTSLPRHSANSCSSNQGPLKLVKYYFDVLVFCLLLLW